jgi:hypothetical protein
MKKGEIIIRCSHMISTGASSQSTSAISRLPQEPLRTQYAGLSLRKQPDRKCKNSAIKTFLSHSPNGSDSDVSLVPDKRNVRNEDDDYKFNSRKRTSIATSTKILRKIIDRVNSRDDNDSSEDDVPVSSIPVKSRRLGASSASSGTSPTPEFTSQTKPIYEKMVNRIFPKTSKDGNSLIVKKEVKEEEVEIVDTVEVKPEYVKLAVDGMWSQ